MMKNIRQITRLSVIAILAFFAMMSSSMANPAIDRLTFITEEYPPFNFSQDGELRGLSVEIVEEMLKRAGSKFNKSDIQLLPWAKGYQFAQSKPGTALFSTTRTESREKLFKWVGPLAPTIIGIIAKKDKGFKVDTIEDLSQLHIGVVKDDIGQLLLEEAGVPDRMIEPVLLNDQNFKKLFADRIDAMAYENNVARWLIASKGEDASEYTVVYELQRSELFLALHLDTPDEAITALQDALDAMKADGTYQAITAKY